MTDDDRLPWFPCFPDKWLSAFAAMGPEEGYLYWIVCLRIYETGGPCRDTPEALSLRTHMKIKRVEVALESLKRTGKLVVRADGLHNPFAEKIIADAIAKRRRLAESGSHGGKKSSEKRKQNQSRASSEASPKTKPPSSNLELELDSEGANAPSAGQQEAPDARVYRRGREVLGNNAGGLVRRVIDHHRGNFALAVSSIEQSSTKSNPREWIGALLRGQVKGNQSPTRNGFAALAAEMNEPQESYDGPVFDLDAVSTEGPARLLEGPARNDKRRS